MDLAVLLGHDTIDPTHDDAQTLQQEARQEMNSLRAALEIACRTTHPRNTPSIDYDAIYDDKTFSNAAVTELKKSFAGLKVRSRAKVTENRIYSAAYHPERTKDLVFFGDKNGQLGIWDAAIEREDGDEDPDGEGGKPYRLQEHWPKASKSAISCIKFNPVDAHSVGHSGIFYFPLAHTMHFYG